MGRPGLEDNIKSGILTPINVSYITRYSHTTIRAWLEGGHVPMAHRMPSGGGAHKGEWKVPAPGMIEFLTKRNMPIPEMLQAAAEAYVRIYGKVKSASEAGFIPSTVPQ